MHMHIYIINSMECSKQTERIKFIKLFMIVVAYWVTSFIYNILMICILKKRQHRCRKFSGVLIRSDRTPGIIRFFFCLAQAFLFFNKNCLGEVILSLIICISLYYLKKPRQLQVKSRLAPSFPIFKSMVFPRIDYN